ncbi:putative glycoside hydrolase [Herbivorax sp. ANBcel31]|uniref:putative glycoside hydrolase n=1 Tax=Herbivorax sp. ANBcel31 TaxID=3069754 RepID=UPI0027B6193C|nr:putative glycoside hydrolase [Herbivorax sp. ANBcel31]MDQ2086306.1 putative glycoside hydrolase [Herbivorax sp. ANBcel31]
MKNKFAFKVLLAIIIGTVLLTVFTSCSGKIIQEDSETTTEVPNSIEEQGEPEPTPEPTPKPTPEPTPEPVKAKALFLSSWPLSIQSNIEHFVNLANTTEINAYVIDIKDDTGYVSYPSEVPLVKEKQTYQSRFKIEEVVREFQENDIYVIGRVVVFKDPVIPEKMPEWAIRDTSGGFLIHNGMTWVNPYNKDAWKYNVDIAKEALEKGVDEIQFDYVRFPDGNKNRMVFPGAEDKELHEAINEFLAYARSEMPDAIISADVFGIICESPADTEKIGQYLELIGKDVDYICPMIYPSHYYQGQKINGVVFPKPDFDPYGVVYNTLVRARDRIAKVPDYNAKVRPYLQDFTASWLGQGNFMKYGAEEVRQQIQAVYDAGYEEWILWNSNIKYSEEAFKKE